MDAGTITPGVSSLGILMVGGYPEVLCGLRGLVIRDVDVWTVGFGVGVGLVGLGVLCGVGAGVASVGLGVL